MYYVHVLMSGNNALAAAKRRRVGIQTPNQSMSNTNFPPVSEGNEEGGNNVLSVVDALTTHNFRLTQIEKVLDKFFIEGGVFHRLDKIEKELASLKQNLQQQADGGDGADGADAADAELNVNKGSVALDISEKNTEPTFTKK